MPSQKHWQNRAVRDYAKIVNKTEEQIYQKLAPMYKQAAESIRADIEALYQKYADKKGLTLAEAKKRVTEIDLKNTDFTADEAKVKSRITRLEMIQNQVDSHVERLYGDVQESMSSFLRQTYIDGYYSAQSIVGKEYGMDFTLINTRAVNNVILQDWSSDSLLKHKDKLKKELRETLTTGLIKGSGVDVMARQLPKRTDVKFSDAKRLIRTESNYAFNKGAIDGYIKSGIVEEYQFLSVLDNRTSKECTKLDGEIFKLRDASVGLNCPPMHPNCRSTTVAYFGEDLSKKSRLARDPDGNNYYVSGDTTYES